MKKIIASLCILLSGCISVPVDKKFPETPAELQQSCPELKLIDPTTKLSDVVGIVSTNYGQYNECQVKTDSWIDWYTNQKKIFEDAK